MAMVPGCCENGRPVIVDKLTGRSSCTCKYPHGAMPLPQIYDGSHPPQHAYLPLKHDAFSFYSPLVRGGYDPIKEGALGHWGGLHTPHRGGMCVPFDTPLSPYSYKPSFSSIGYDAARRKNATKESTSTLKSWLSEHRKNPYPTKAEKIMLAIITKMTVTQISTWFANARRRLKKENKMTWSSQSRSDHEDSDADVERDDAKTTAEASRAHNRLQGEASHHDSHAHEATETASVIIPLNSSLTFRSKTLSTKSQVKPPPELLEHQIDDISPPNSRSNSPERIRRASVRSSDHNSEQSNKPKIWSISQVLSDNHSTEVTSTNINTSSLQSHNYNTSLARMAHTAHASQVLNGRGFAILSGNGGATHTWNPHSLPTHGFHEKSRSLSLELPHSQVGSHIHASRYSGPQHRVMAASVFHINS